MLDYDTISFIPGSICSLSLSATVKHLQKLVHICQSYLTIEVACFYDPQCTESRQKLNCMHCFDESTTPVLHDSLSLRGHTKMLSKKKKSNWLKDTFREIQECLERTLSQRVTTTKWCHIINSIFNSNNFIAIFSNQQVIHTLYTCVLYCY